MAIVQRFFSPTSAGSGDGTTWANRAALHLAGTWSSVVTGFNFSGSDSLQCFVGPGSYSISLSLDASLFANPPSMANPLLMCGCDSSGALLPVPDPSWVSAKPAWSDSSLPELITTVNVSITTLPNSVWYLIKMNGNANTSTQVLSGHLTLSWCSILNNANNTLARCVSGPPRISNCVLKCTGTAYDHIIVSQTEPISIFNSRVEGVTGASGTRGGIQTVQESSLVMVTVVNCGGNGIDIGSATTAGFRANRCVIANNGGDGFVGASNASQTSWTELRHCMITGHGGVGVNGNTAAARIVVNNSRLRDNVSGDITGLGNYPTDLNNYTTDSDDASEYVSAGANGDFRIKNTAAIWGLGYGVADQPAPEPLGVRI